MDSHEKTIEYTNFCLYHVRPEVQENHCEQRELINQSIASTKQKSKKEK